MLSNMLLRLYIVPCLLLISAFLSLWLFGNIIPNHFSQSNILVGITELSNNLMLWISSGLSVAALVSFGISSYKLWQWENCSGDSCSRCGGIALLKLGRYGAYFHCIACNRNRTY